MTTISEAQSKTKTEILLNMHLRGRMQMRAGWAGRWPLGMRPASGWPVCAPPRQEALSGCARPGLQQGVPPDSLDDRPSSSRLAGVDGVAVLAPSRRNLRGKRLAQRKVRRRQGWGRAGGLTGGAAWS